LLSITRSAPAGARRRCRTAQQLVDEGGLAVVDVGDDGDVADQAGATSIVSVASVGGIRADLGPGAPSSFRTRSSTTPGAARSTFHEGGDAPVVHIDFTQPYDPAAPCCWRRQRDAGEDVTDGGVYAATQGPRLETAAEIDRLERDGADIVGMTGMPEAAWRANSNCPMPPSPWWPTMPPGRGDSTLGIQFASLEDILRESMERVRRIIEMICIEPR
jgi:5'-methylthioinosine phosphorylase